MNQKQMSVLSGALLLTASGLFSHALGFFYRVWLSRLIGAEALGLYQLILPVYSLLYAATAMGLTAAASALSAKARALGGEAGSKGVLRGSAGIFFLLFLPLGAGVIVFSEWISTELLCDARTRLGLILLVPCVLLTGLEDIQKYCLFGIGQVKIPAVSEIFEQLIRTGAVLGLLALGSPRSLENTVAVIVAGMILCEVFSVVFLCLASKKFFRSPVNHVGITGLPLRQLFAIAAPIGVSSTITTLLSSVNYILLPQKLVESGLGISAAMSSFGVLCGMTMPMLMLPTGFVGALGLTVVPELARKSALGQKREICRQLDRALTSVSVIITPILALLTVMGPAVGRALFHNGQVGEYSLPLAAGTMFYCWQLILSGALNSLGQQRAAASNRLLCCGVQLVFTWFAVPRFGLGAYAAGFLCMQALNFFLDFAVTRRALDWRPRPLKGFAPIMLSALLMAFSANFVFRFLIDNRISVLFGFVFCLCFALPLYLLTLRFQGVSLQTSPGKA